MSANQRASAHNLVIQELLDTELNYNQDLVKLTNAFNLMDGPLSGKFQAQLAMLKNISEKICTNITESLDDNKSIQQRTALKIKRNQLGVAFFATYKEYTQLHNEYRTAIQVNPDLFLDLEEHVYSIDQRGLDALLITPIQRGPRYVLLLKAALEDGSGLDLFNQEDFAALSELVTSSLTNINQALPPVNKPYQFGDFTKKALNSMFKPKEIQPEPEVYLPKVANELK